MHFSVFWHNWSLKMLILLFLSVINTYPIQVIFVSHPISDFVLNWVYFETSAWLQTFKRFDYKISFIVKDQYTEILHQFFNQLFESYKRWLITVHNRSLLNMESSIMITIKLKVLFDVTSLSSRVFSSYEMVYAKGGSFFLSI